VPATGAFTGIGMHEHEQRQPARESGHDGRAGHSHGLTAANEVAGASDARLLWTVVFNQLLTVAQVVAGIFSGSLALLSDAAHNFNDANALLIAYVARRISRRGANERYTFGYRRAELIGAMVNLTTLGVVGLYLVYEAVMRFFNPEPIVGWLMAAAAGLALVVDVATAALLWSMSRGSLNVRAAFVHNLTDALGSVAVLVGAAAIIWLGWTWVDPALTLLIAGYVLWQVATMLPQAMRILMEGTPPGMKLEDVAAAMAADPRVQDVHHLHVWQLDEGQVALEAHIVAGPGLSAGDRDGLRHDVKLMLTDRFRISHSTVEIESATAAGAHAAGLLSHGT
jgi:cobalt-zinc-cadmium efflux system protein